MPQLEGLRGLLAIGVVLHHAVVRFILLPRTGVWDYPPSNFYGQLASAPVLMFFFLTGFLFWSKLERKPGFAVRPYLMARLRRLGPVYLFAMAWFFVLVAVSTHFTLHVPMRTLAISGLRWLGFAVAGQPDVNGLTHSWYLIAGTPWTLAFEWQFYLLLPWLGWFARRWHRSAYLVAGAAISFAITGRALVAAGIAGHTSIGSLVFAAHGLAGHLFLSFGVGIAVASLRSRWRGDYRWLRSGTVSWACVLVVGAVLFGSRQARFKPLDSVALGAVFLCVAFGNDLWKCLCSRTAMLLGRVSYSLYLCHGLALASLSLAIQSGRGSTLFAATECWMWIAGSCVAALLIAVAVHEAVEAPWMLAAGRPGASAGKTSRGLTPVPLRG